MWERQLNRDANRRATLLRNLHTKGHIYVRATQLWERVLSGGVVPLNTTFRAKKETAFENNCQCWSSTSLTATFWDRCQEPWWVSWLEQGTPPEASFEDMIQFAFKTTFFMAAWLEQRRPLSDAFSGTVRKYRKSSTLPALEVHENRSSCMRAQKRCFN